MDTPMRPTAAERRAQHFAEFKREREQEEQERRDRVIAEFNGDPQAMATEILRCHSLAQIADAIDWMRQGAPFITMGPGPHWKPKPVPVPNEERKHHGGEPATALPELQKTRSR
jgi:hypothetical protein